MTIKTDTNLKNDYTGPAAAPVGCLVDGTTTEGRPTISMADLAKMAEDMEIDFPASTPKPKSARGLEY